MMFAFLNAESEVLIVNRPMVCEFPYVFPNYISDLLSEREVQFPIDLVPSARPVSMESYKMSALELSELMKHLEDLLEKKFVRPSVSQWGAPKLLVKKKDGSMR